MTVTQALTLEHTTDGGTAVAHDDGVSLTGAAAISVVQHVTDGDGDFDEATSQNALTITFQDDGPNAAAVAGTASVIVDESALPNGVYPDGINPGTIAAATIAALFAAPAYGADGPGAVSYKLAGVDNAHTGLWLTGQSGAGNEILLHVVSDTVIEGRVGGGGALAFTISINGGTGALAG